MTKRRVAVVGAGHNGLVAACYLAKAGFEVTVLERRPVVGGAVVTEAVFPGHKIDTSTNVLSIGVDIETGGHVFQLHFTNSIGMIERTFIAENSGTWGNGDILFGFNISRVFNIGKKNTDRAKKPGDVNGASPSKKSEAPR